MNLPEYRCHNCAAAISARAVGFEKLRRVTSDCKPWKPGGQLLKCDGCGLVQANADVKWRDESTDIYNEYEIYHQSAGAEQTVFDQQTGAGLLRSEAICRGLENFHEVNPTGRLLDIGCGNGSLIKAFGMAFPGWTFCGTEFDNRHRRSVEALQRVEYFHNGDVSEVEGLFDLISLNHVLEHVMNPAGLLQKVHHKLSEEGLLIIQVPDCEVNPFVLLVADHASHFSKTSLSNLVCRVGFELLEVGNRWVHKEISIVARKVVGARYSAGAPAISGVCQTFQNIDFIFAVIEQAQVLARKGRWGIFGTSIAATWLDTQTGSSAEFFVDEDPHRIGRRHFDRPIYAVSDIPAAAHVFMALPSATSRNVAKRLREKRPDVEFVEA
jgi:2-polyprenyl-3-methyl-5-hydroxy-6-metoxy-1,4-benzoquinol methylase